MEPLEEQMRRYREGDAAAQQEVLAKLESELRGLVRALMGNQIRSDRESMDVCQSLLLAFHLRAADGKIELPNEKAMRAYLRSMIRHKMANLSDRIRSAKRGGGVRPASIHASDTDQDQSGIQLPALDPSASMVAGTAELRLKLEETLTPDELAILEGRLAGRTNQEIADDTGKSADGVRMTWNRAREKLASRGLLKLRD